MKRIALIVASGAAALTASLAMAQPAPLPNADGPRHERMREDRMRDDRNGEARESSRERRVERMTARLNERLVKLRTDLKLRPEQVPLFDNVEALIKRNAEQRREQWAALREQRENFRHADIMERLDTTANRLSQRATRSKELADTVRPLWTTLSDEQKTVARRAVREAMGDGHRHMAQMRERWEERRGGRDRDRDDDRGPRRRHERSNDRED